VIHFIVFSHLSHLSQVLSPHEFKHWKFLQYRNMLAITIPTNRVIWDLLISTCRRSQSNVSWEKPWPSPLEQAKTCILC
jgi:hypothetical protein